MDTDDLEVQAIHEHVELAGRRVLEVGCGSGRISQQIAHSAGFFVGVDPDPRAIARAAAAIPGGLFQIGSGESLPFADASFDIVLFTLSLHHQQPMLALHEAARIVRPYGQVLIIEPITTSEAQQVFNLFEDETAVLAQAQEAIATGPLQIRSQRTVHALWELRDSDELLAYPFSPDGLDGAQKAAILRAHLGALFDARPIRLVDSLTYTLLGRIEHAL